MKQLFIILFLLIGFSSYGQVFTQTFVDRCTGDVKIVTANFISGSATVAFYDKVRTFTYQEFISGELQQWLNETYNWWNLLSPCSAATQQAQQAQQTAQTAQTAAQTAASAAASVPVVPASPPPTSSTPPATNTTGGGTSGTTQTNNNNTTESNNTNTSNTSEGSSTEGGGSTTESNGGESSETKTEETKTEDTKSEESKSEESSEGGGEEEGGGDDEGGTEEEGGDDDGDGEESEEVSEEEKKEEKKDEKKERVKKFNPVQVKADMMAMQTMLGSYDGVISMGASQTSLFGDTTYGLTGMVWSNFRQFSINGSYSKVNMNIPNLTTLIHGDHTHYGVDGKASVKSPLTPPQATVGSIDAFSIGYSNNFGNGTIVLSANKMKPMGKWGTGGIGFSVANMFGEGKFQMSIVGYNVLYTNVVNVSERITYAPAIIWTQSPFMTLSGNPLFENNLKGTKIGGMGILANSFTLRLTRRFTINAGWTLIKGTDKRMPLMNSFMIGSKLPF